jgi:hypothetical protein
MKLQGILWTDTIEVLSNHTVTITDLGLVLGPGPSGWTVPEQGLGTDTAVSQDGAVGELELSLKEGFVTRLILRDPMGEFEVYRNNTYKSSPNLEYTKDARPLILWSEASYAEDYSTRASSLRLMYILGDGKGNFSSDPMGLYHSSSSDLHPALAADRSTGEIAVAWVRDLDADPRSLSDREIMIGTFDGSVWTPPLPLTDDIVVDQDPDIWYSPLGDLWISWLSGNKTLKYTTRPKDGDWSPVMVMDAGRTLRVHEHSMAGGEHASPAIAMTASEPGEPYELIVLGGGDLTTDPLAENMTLQYSNGYFGSPGMMVDDSSFSYAYWVDHSSPGGDIYSSMNAEGPLEDAWTSPLRITNDEAHEMYPALLSLESGLFLLSFHGVEGRSGASDGGTGPFRTVNLSWGAGIISIDLDPGIDLSVGEMVKVTVLVESQAIYPAGIVRVDLYRRVRDRDTGGLMDETWESRVVEFTRAKQRGQASFTVPVKEFQLGLVARTSPPLEGIPAQSSSMFVSLPALPDPEIISIGMSEQHASGPNTTVVVGLRNWGIVDVGKWDLQIRASPPTPSVQFKGKLFEPINLRNRSHFTVLNSTMVDMDKGAQISVEMNISLAPGINHLWATIRGPLWIPESESPSSLMVHSTPSAKVTSLEAAPLILKEDPLDIILTVKNEGIWPLNVSMDTSGIPLVDGMVIDHPMRWIWVEIRDKDGATLFINISSIGDLGPHHTQMFNWSFEHIPGVMTYFITAGLSPGPEPGRRSDPTLKNRVDVLVEPEVVITRIDSEWSSTNLGRGLKVGVRNPSNTTAKVVHLILYNGYPSDGVIVSEALAVGIGPNGSKEILLPLQLEEGRYILAVTASCAAPPAGGSVSIWRNPTIEITDMSIEPPPDPENGDTGEVDMDDVTSSLVISAAASMFVLMVSSVFFKRQQEED